MWGREVVCAQLLCPLDREFEVILSLYRLNGWMLNSLNRCIRRYFFIVVILLIVFCSICGWVGSEFDFAIDVGYVPILN